MSSSPARSLVRVPAAALSLFFAACGSDAATTADRHPRVERVVLVTVDGLRADALDSMPTLSSLREAAVWTDQARSVLPAITLPAHLSLLTGRDVPALGIRGNDFGETEALAMYMAGAAPVFHWIDGESDAVIGASLLPPEYLHQARSFFHLRRLTATSLDDDVIVDAAIQASLADDAPALLFVHLPEVDLAGHASGWIAGGEGAEQLGNAYLVAVRAADAALGRLHSALAPDIAAGRTALIITADHGGGHGLGCVDGMPPEREHCTAHEADQLVPLMIVARDLAPRRLAGVVPITGVAATVAHLLGETPLPGVAASILP